MIADINSAIPDIDPAVIGTKAETDQMNAVHIPEKIKPIPIIRIPIPDSMQKACLLSSLTLST